MPFIIIYNNKMTPPLETSNSPKWKHSMLRKRPSRRQTLRDTCHRTYSNKKRYYRNNVLYVVVGNKTLKYPPKAGIMMFNKEFTKILLVKNNYHPYPKCQKWGYPKGHLEKGETSNICATRELYEETGLKINIDSYKTVSVNNSHYYVYYADESIINSVQPIDTNEINDAAFHDLSTIHSLNLNREASVLIKKDLEYLKLIARPYET